MPLKNVLGNSCAFVAKHLGLRHRYVFTKNNRLRLRYVAGMTAACAAGLPTAVAFAPLSQGFPVQFEIATAAQAYNVIEPSAGVPLIADGDDMLEGSEMGSVVLASLPQFEEPAKPTDRIVTIGKGDVLGTVMQREGVAASEVHEIIQAMGKNFNPRSLKVGQDVQMHFEPHEDEEGAYKLTDLKIQINPLKTVTVKRTGNDFAAEVEEKEVKPVVLAQKTVIKNSLYGSAALAGIPKSVVANAIKIYSQNVDFQRDVHSGDSLEVMYESHQTEDGYVAETGEVLYARLTLAGRTIPLYRYESEDGSVDYYGPNGESMKKTLMKTPIDGARMSSGYGMRRHPVLGYSKMHKGMDFAAPTGTPIYAAGDGVVKKAGRFSSYGNYIRIRHTSELDTAYAHLSKMSVRDGQRVKQGQVIGYVGTTGRSTGPHLHYEILVANKHVDPRGVNLPTGQALAGRDLKKFKTYVKGVESQYAALSGGAVKIAQRQVAKGESFN